MKKNKINFMSNYGIILRKPKPQDWRYGNVTGIKSKVLNESGSWNDCVPTVEYQNSLYFDSYACITFSALNCIEILLRKMNGLEYNFSDRYTAKMSGTTTLGNYLNAVGDSIRKDGLLSELTYPYPRDQRTPPFTWGDYYKEITPEYQEQAKKIYNNYEFNYEWVEIIKNEDLLEYLKYAPIQIVIHAFGKKVNNIYQKTLDKPNHAVVAINAVKDGYIEIFDSYELIIKRLSWDYIINTYGLKYSVTIKNNNMNKPEIKNNTLVQLVEGQGGFGYYLDGNIIVDDLAKILATDRMRNKERNTIALKQSEWNLFDKVTLKGEKI